MRGAESALTEGALMNAHAVALVLVSTLVGLLIPFLPAEAQQQTQRVFRVGVLSSGNPSPNLTSLPGYSRIVERLAELGFRQGQNLILEYRWAEGKMDRVQPLATELVDARMDVILAVGANLARIIAAAKVPVPVVSVSCDLFSTVTDYARPTGNLTGVTCMSQEMSPKRLELVKRVVPLAKHVVFLRNPVQGPFVLELTQKAASQLGLVLRVVEIRSADEMSEAFAAIAAERPDALLVDNDALMVRLRKEIAEFALAQRLPSIYGYPEFVEAGGLISYGGLTSELAETGAELTAKILRGAKPHELPIQQVKRIHMTINMKSARAIGLEIPYSVRVSADRVIE